MDFVSLSSSPHDDICVGWTREKTMTKSAKLAAHRTGVRPSPFFSSFTVECVSWYWESKYPRQNQSYFVFAVKYLVLPWGFWLCREVLLFLPWGFWFCREVFCFCREVFGFAVTVVGHHSFVLAVAWSTEKKGKNNSAGRSARTCVTFGQMTSLVCDAHSQQNWQTTGGRCPRWLKKTFFWQLHQMRFGILFIQKTGIKRKLHRSVY